MDRARIADALHDVGAFLENEPVWDEPFFGQLEDSTLALELLLRIETAVNIPLEDMILQPGLTGDELIQLMNDYLEARDGRR